MESRSQLDPFVRFGPFELDVRSAEIRYNGHATLLHEQPFQVLLALLERPGELVSREELVKRLWPDGTFVDYERGLNKAVNKLRDVLRDSADSPRFVETIPRRGYRFIAPLEGGSAPINGSSGAVVVETGTHHRIWLAVGATVTFALIAAAGYGGYSLLSKHAEPFENFTISQITHTGKVAAAAISPDSRFLLTEVDDDSKRGLWLRNIGTNSDTQVTPPEDTFYAGLAFSPDGNYIYFLRQDELNGVLNVVRVPVLGGTQQVVVRAIDSRITFSPKGKRIAYLRMNDPVVGKFQLLTANADGTDEKMLTSGTVHAGGAVAWSPDDKQIALAIPGLGGSLGGLQLVETASAKMQPFGRFNKMLGDLAWLPDGRGLLATYGDPGGRLQVGFISNPDGQFRTVTKDTSSYAWLTLSADGKTLVTVQQRSSQTLYLMPAAGFAGRPPNPAPAQNKDSFSFGWASNEDLYFDGDTLMRISADGHNRTRLLGDPNDQIFGSERCDEGRYVVFARVSHDARNKISIWRVDADGSNPKQLTDVGIEGIPTCSPESKWAYYYDFDDEQIKRVPIDGGTPEIVPGTVIPNAAIGSGPAISPDGKLLAFFSQKVGKVEGNYAPPKIALVNLDAGPEPPRRILEPDPRTAGRTGDALHFTPDGKAVVYQFGGVDNLWLQPLDGSRGRQITNFKSDEISAYHFSPDGKTLGVMHSHSESDAVLLRDTGSSQQ